ncbi:MAG: thioredoxin family protein [Pseudomonadota bacterium]
MRFIIAATAAALITACGQAQNPQEERIAVTAPAADTRIVAVLSYASWCGSCKALDPKVAAVQSANTFDGVAFARLDFSDRDTNAFFADAETLGVAATMRAEFSDKVKTGRMYLIDLSSGEIISTVDKSMSEAEIASTISEAAALT